MREDLAVKAARARLLSSQDLSMIQWRGLAKDLKVDLREASKAVPDNGDLDQAGEVLKAGPVDGEDRLVTGDLGLRVRQ